LNNIPVSTLELNGSNIFAGTFGNGIFYSTNNGGVWIQKNEGLLNLNINSIYFSPDFIFAGTYGSSVWKRPYSDLIGIKPIRNEISKSFRLFQNYPNPFNPVTNIRFELPKTGFVTINIYDITGKLVESLVNEELNAGTYNVDWNAANYSSGVYFYQLSAVSGTTEFTQTKKMILIK
jgi:hypothetical protein